LARMARKQNENDKLPGLYTKALESDPRSYAAHMAFAGYYSDPPHQDFQRMEQHCAAALDLNADRAGAYRLLVFALAAQQRFDAATKLLARAEVALPADSSPYYYAARGLLTVAVEMPKAEEYLRTY